MTTFVHLVTPLGDMKLVTIANTWKMNLNFGTNLDSDFDSIQNDLTKILFDFSDCDLFLIFILVVQNK